MAGLTQRQVSERAVQLEGQLDAKILAATEAEAQLQTQRAQV